MDNLEAENKGSDLPRETFSGLTPGKKYYVRVTAFTYTPAEICFNPLTVPIVPASDFMPAPKNNTHTIAMV